MPSAANEMILVNASSEIREPRTISAGTAAAAASAPGGTCTARLKRPKKPEAKTMSSRP